MSLPSVYAYGEADIMAGAIFQIKWDFSLPGRLGRLLGGRNLPEKLLDYIVGCGRLHFPFKKVRNQRGLGFRDGSSQSHPWEKEPLRLHYWGKETVGGCLWPVTKTRCTSEYTLRLLFLAQGPEKRKKLY